jgi:NACalpha-BTF3-like transcription factor
LSKKVALTIEAVKFNRKRNIYEISNPGIVLSKENGKRQIAAFQKTANAETKANKIDTFFFRVSQVLN